MMVKPNKMNRMQATARPGSAKGRRYHMARPAQAVKIVTTSERMIAIEIRATPRIHSPLFSRTERSVVPADAYGLSFIGFSTATWLRRMAISCNLG